MTRWAMPAAGLAALALATFAVWRGRDEVAEMVVFVALGFVGGYGLRLGRERGEKGEAP
jgi:hypothetical protein